MIWKELNFADLDGLYESTIANLFQLFILIYLKGEIQKSTVRFKIPKLVIEFCYFWVHREFIFWVRWQKWVCHLTCLSYVAQWLKVAGSDYCIEDICNLRHKVFSDIYHILAWIYCEILRNNSFCEALCILKPTCIIRGLACIIPACFNWYFVKILLI